MSNSGILFIILILIAAMLASYYYQSQGSAIVVPMVSIPEPLNDLPPTSTIASTKQQLLEAADKLRADLSGLTSAAASAVQTNT